MPDDKPKTVDYDALAKQYGSVSSSIDYDALAKQHGAISEAYDPLRGASQATELSPQPKPFTKAWLRDMGIRLGLNFADTLPAIGGTGGGIIGATGGSFAEPGGGSVVGGVGGAGIGGMAGEAGKQFIYHSLGWPAPITSGEAAGQITKAGLTQAGTELFGRTLQFAAKPLSRGAAAQYERALAPTTRINKSIAREITPELIRRGEAGSLEGLEKTANQKISQLSPKLNSAYQEAGVMRTSSGAALPGAKIAGSGDKVLNDLEALKQSYMPEGKVAQPQAVKAIEGVQDVIRQYGSDISPDSLRRLRQIFEEVPAERGAYAGVDLSTNYTLHAEQQAADSIRGILNKNPDIGTLNREISFWMDVRRVTSQSGLRRTGQEGGLLKTMAPLATALAGGGAGFAAHSPEAGLGAAATTMLATAAVKITRSPWWRTSSAVAKSRIADALARGDVGQISAILGRIGLSATETNTRDAQPNQ